MIIKKPINNKILIGCELINLFNNLEFEAYLVGGCVRDFIMQREIKDIDITTNATPNEIIEVALLNNIKYIETGLEHGTITWIFKGEQIEVTTYRIDILCDGRHAEVQFVKSLEEDLKRRDITINAMAMSKDMQIIDLFDGIKHISKKLIMMVNNPLLRIQEDKLRALRVIRFATVFNFEIEYHTYEILKFVDLSILSKERIRDEFIKIIASPNRVRGLSILDDTGLLKQIIPELDVLKGVNQDNIHHPEKDAFLHTMYVLCSIGQLINPENGEFVDNSDNSLELILAIILHDIAKPLTRIYVSDDEVHFYEHENVGAELAEKILERLKFARMTIDKVKWLVLNHMRIHKFNEMKKSKKVKLIEHEYFEDLINLAICDIKGSSSSIADHKCIFDIDMFIGKYKEEVKIRPILKQKIINGFDIMELGLTKKDGILIGQILEKVNDAIIEGNINTKEEALDFVRKLI